MDSSIFSKKRAFDITIGDMGHWRSNFWLQWMVEHIRVRRLSIQPWIIIKSIRGFDMEIYLNKENLKIGVVILNYMAYKETINCVRDFLSLAEQGSIIKIVVVDNYSNNDSFEKIKKEFAFDNRVLIARTNKNLGFANGNNYGYEVLKKNFNPDYVIISNDDILLPDKNLCDWIIQSHKKYDFAVLGPSVYSTGGNFFQSPMSNFPTDKKQCIKELIKQYKSALIVKIKILLHVRNRQDKNKVCHDTEYKVATDKKTLHGSFLIFSKKYFEFYDEPFDKGTFLYMEEDILRLRCNQKNLKMIYDPTYCVYHLQSVATNMITQDQLKRDYRRLKNIIQSMKYYITLL